MAKYFETHGDGCEAQSPTALAVAGRPWPGLSVLDLGSGTGALGLAVAALGANVTLTDQASFVYPGRPGEGVGARSLLDLMRRNTASNAGQHGAAGQAPVAVRELLWGADCAAAGLPHAQYDLICASDVLLFQGAHAALVATLRAASGPATVVVIGHSDRSGADDSAEAYPDDLRAFFAAVAADGLWRPAVVADQGRHLALRLVRLGRGERFDVGDLPPRRST